MIIQNKATLNFMGIFVRLGKFIRIDNQRSPMVWFVISGILLLTYVFLVNYMPHSITLTVVEMLAYPISLLSVLSFLFSTGLLYLEVNGQTLGYSRSKTAQARIDEINREIDQLLLEVKTNRENAFKTLDLKTDASQDEIHSAYRRMAKKYHPDLNKNNPSAESLFLSVKSAYELLKD